MEKLTVKPNEFPNVKNLLNNEGIKFTYEVIKGFVIITVPTFFLKKYGYL